MQRSLEPEILDSLPFTHPDALHNRRDLRLTNMAMGNYAWFRRVLPRLVRAADRVLEIGAGTGELGRQLARRGIALDGLDLWPRPSDWPAAQAWHVADMRHFRQWDDYEVVLGNLIFHQFSDGELRDLGKRMARARVIVACEPARSRKSQLAFATIAPLLGANHVTLHDARVSIAAGFSRDELPVALGLDSATWDVSFGPSWIGAYRMIARRRE
jgi:SAM-dependent methyltransferase